MGKRLLDWDSLSFIDTHCHLNLPEYENDLDQVIQDAMDKGITRIVVPATDLASSHSIVELCEKYPSVYGAVGVHPETCESYLSSQKADLIRLLDHPKMVAVGEIGLDCFHRTDNVDTQVEVFQTMLEIAIDRQKPVIIHSRDCLEMVIELVKSSFGKQRNGILNGVFHSFEGNLQDAEMVIELGFVIGAGGPITYKNASIKHELFSKIDLEKVVLETDGPYLSPQSQRGRRNLPELIPEIAMRLAQLQKSDLSQVSRITTKTAFELFHMD
jgi:TatD DNase family protein